MHKCTHTRIHGYTTIWNTTTQIYEYKCIHICTYEYTHTQICKHTHLQTHEYTHIHIHEDTKAETNNYPHTQIQKQTHIHTTK